MSSEREFSQDLKLMFFCLCLKDFVGMAISLRGMMEGRSKRLNEVPIKKEQNVRKLYHSHLLSL